jgi:ribosomal protein S18 acetylase RimI-like enzyme
VARDAGAAAAVAAPVPLPRGLGASRRGRGLSAAPLELERRIQASIRADACRSRDVERIGPFVATFTRYDPNPFLNYAIPDEEARPGPADVEALAAAYLAHDRTARLEYLPALAPAVEPALVAAGFLPESRLPLLIAVEVRELLLDGIELIEPSTADDYRAVAVVQWEAYQEEGEPPPRVASGLRRSAEAGGVVLLAREACTGEAAGAGQCTPPHDGLTELTSVGVRPAFRRRGIAQALAGRLARVALERAATGVFLMAHCDAEARIYERAGFERLSEVSLVSRS